MEMEKCLISISQTRSGERSRNRPDVSCRAGSADLANLLGRPATGPAEIVRARMSVLRAHPVSSDSREAAGLNRSNPVDQIQNSERFPLADVPSIFSRGDSKFVSKRNGQVGLTRKPASECDLRDTELYLFKQLSRALDTALQHVSMGRHARRCTKHPQEVASAIADFCR